MASYLYRLQYTKSGLEGTIKEGFAKREAFFRKTVDGLGGKTETAHWAYGEDDVLIIVSFPVADSAVALALALGATGSFRVTTTPLLTAKEMDAGAKRMPSYRAPGT
jgi:uncharacterized protein with GYD domain